MVMIDEAKSEERLRAQHIQAAAHTFGFQRWKTERTAVATCGRSGGVCVFGRCVGDHIRTTKALIPIIRNS